MCEEGEVIRTGKLGASPICMSIASLETATCVHSKKGLVSMSRNEESDSGLEKTNSGERSMSSRASSILPGVKEEDSACSGMVKVKERKVKSRGG